MNNNEAQLKAVHSNYSKQANDLRYQSLLNSCSPADKQVIVTLAELEKLSQGRLKKLFHVYMAIKEHTTL